MPWDEGRPMILAASAVLCFVNSYDGRFVFDDAEAIVNNKDVVGSAVPWYNVICNDFWGTPLTSNVSHKSWRPLTTTTFRLNFLLTDLNPVCYHLVNLLLHILVVLLLYEVVGEVLFRTTKQRTRSWNISFWCSLLFSVHPVHTECVASVVGRAELLCATFFLLSFKCFLVYLSDNDRERNGGNFFNGAALWRCIIYSTLSILSKEQGITSLAVCLLYDVLINSRHDLDYVFNAAKRRASDALNNNNTDKRCSVLSLPVLSLIRRTSLISVCLIIQFILRMWIIGFEPPIFTAADNPASFHPNRLIRCINYNYLYALNSWILINPSTLCFDYSMGCVDLIENLFDYRVLFVILFWIVVIGLFAHCYRCSRSCNSVCILLALIWTITTFLPAANVFFRVGFVLAERVLYLPSVGFCLLTALAFDRLRRTVGSKGQLVVVNSGFIMLIMVFSLKSMHRSSEWKDEASLFTSGARMCPTNAKVHYNLGKILNDFGSREEAQIAYQKALKLRPNYEQAMNNLANLYKDNGDFREAEKLLESAVDIRPNFAAAWMNLGIVKAALKKYSQSERSYSNALFYRPNYADCLFNLGNLYLEMGRESDALNAWLNATRLKPIHEKAWINIILLLDNRGDINAALHYGSRALSHISTEPGIYFAVGNCLGKLDRFVESESYFLKAIQLDTTNANYYNNLGVLYHRWKKFDRAEMMYVKALQLNPQLEHAKEHLNKVRKFLTKQI